MDTHTTLRLERLPAELWQIIAVNVRDYHKPSFVSLASSSKSLRAICSPILFSAIIVEPPYDKIEETVFRCVNALSLNGFLRYVRHLSLQVTPRREDWTEPRRPLTNLSRLPGTAEVDLDILMAVVRPRTRNTDILYDDYDDTDSIGHFDEDDGDYADVYPKDRVPPGNSSDDWDEFPDSGLIKDEDWLPVCRLLEALPNLKDLSFNAQNEVFPTCLLDTIHEHLPYCRISLRQFYLSGNENTRVNSVTSDEDEFVDDDEVVNEDEVDDEDEDEDDIILGLPRPPVLSLRNIAFVRSPNLHDIHFQLDTFYFDGFSFEAALAMVGGVSPNIKAVHLTHCKPSYVNDQPFARNWAGVKELTSTPRPARLTTLALFDTSSLGQWNDIIDASALRSLSLGYQQSSSQGDTIWLAEHASFPNLKHLHLAGFPDFRGEYGWQAVDPFPRPQDTIAEFLAHLPPLESLYIRGPVPVEVIQGMLPHHGPALQKLNIHSSTTGHKFSTQVFQLISEHCSRIQELHIPLRRTASGLDEAAALGALGNIKSLRILRLRLAQGYMNAELEVAADYYASGSEPHLDQIDPSWFLDPLPPRADRPLWAAWDHKRSYLSYEESPDPPIRNGDIRDALIKAAVDETFARAVWDRLSSGQGCCLRLLELYGSTEMQEYGSFPDLYDTMFSFSVDVASMKTHFVLQRSMADDETILVVDLHAAKMKGRKRTTKPSLEFLEHFGRTWPAKTALGSWKEGWSSLPLPVPSPTVRDSN